MPHPVVIFEMGNEIHTKFCCLSCLLSDAYQAWPGMPAWYSGITVLFPAALRRLGSNIPASYRVEKKVKRRGQGLGP